MATNAIKCFRTVVRCGIFRQLLAEDGTTFLVPIGIAVPPQSISLNPGDSVEEPKELALDGRMVPSFTYTKEASPEMEISWGMATLEMESLIHGRVVTSIASGSVEGWVYAEFLADKTAAYPARTAGKLGYGVPVQEDTSNAQVYYINPATKLAVKLTVVETTPAAIGEVQIGQHMAITIHADLAATGFQVYAWVPHLFTAGTVLSATPLGLLTIVALGISFDNKARMLTVRNATRLPGSAMSSESTRQAKLRILPDPADGTGLGYSIVDSPTLTVV